LWCKDKKKGVQLVVQIWINKVTALLLCCFLIGLSRFWGKAIFFTFFAIQFSMRIAAVDIGSNAIRLQVSTLIRYNGKDTIKNLEYIRFPLRLGQDVFNFGSVLPQTSEKFVALMKAFSIMLDLYEVSAYRVCATSAFRDAKNGPELAKRTLAETGIQIDVISGEEEAALLGLALSRFVENGTFIHIDVGGGSTELNIYNDKEKLASESFKLGSVRNMSSGISNSEWLHMESWLKKNMHHLPMPVTAIGTGGNISKLYDLCGLKKKKLKSLTLSELQEVHLMVSRMSVEERIHQLMLNPDRADVIVPASEIYLQTMQLAKSKKIVIPDLGLKDGILETQYQIVKDQIPTYSSPN
jgi:exopolyphosphatase/guanosine-5'-triphosphate,3'-diphosphate pyrophosphatase